MDQMELLRDIPQSASWTLVRPVEKGWSADQKYYVERADGRKLLLRVSSSETHAAKEREFQAMHDFWRLGLNMSEPLEFGRCGDGRSVYSLLSWLDGEPLDEVLCNRSEQEQYALGQQAGQILRQMHTVAAPADRPDWEQHMRRKLKSHLDRYLACGIRVPGDQLALQYIEHNLQLLCGRPQALQHGDYHPGNMILGRDGKLGIIDFNRWDYGDPYEEQYKALLFSRELSIPFVRGQLAAYFGAEIPDLFWRLVALYLADVILFSVAWAMPFGQADVDGMLRRAEQIMDDYAGFSDYQPRWWKN